MADLSTSPVERLESVDFAPEAVLSVARELDAFVNGRETFSSLTVEEIFSLKDVVYELQERVYAELDSLSDDDAMKNSWNQVLRVFQSILHFSSMGVNFRRLGKGDSDPATVERMVHSGTSFGKLRKEMTDFGFSPSVDLVIQMIESCCSEKVFRGGFQQAIHVIGVLGGRVELYEALDTTAKERELAANSIVECLKLLRLTQHDVENLKNALRDADRLLQSIEMPSYVESYGFYLNQPFRRALDYIASRYA
jgi:hypothetical protein